MIAKVLNILLKLLKIQTNNRRKLNELKSTLLSNEMITIITRYSNLRGLTYDVNNNNELDGEVIHATINSVRNLSDQILKL